MADELRRHADMEVVKRVVAVVVAVSIALALEDQKVAVAQVRAAPKAVVVVQEAPLAHSVLTPQPVRLILETFPAMGV